jgi:hypothetical protein
MEPSAMTLIQPSRACVLRPLMPCAAAVPETPGNAATLAVPNATTRAPERVRKSRREKPAA